MTSSAHTPRWKPAIPLLAAGASFVVVSVVVWAAATSLLAPEPMPVAEPKPAPVVAKADDGAGIALKATIADLERRLAERDTDAAKMEALADARGKDYDRVHAENVKLAAENARLAGELKRVEKEASDAKAAADREISIARLRQAAAERSATDAAARSERDATDRRRQLESDLASVESSLAESVKRRDAIQSSYDAVRRRYDAEMTKAKGSYDKDLAGAESARQQARKLGYSVAYAEGFYANTRSSADRNDAARRNEIDARWQPLLAAAKSALDQANALVGDLQSRRSKFLSSLGRQN